MKKLLLTTLLFCLICTLADAQLFNKTKIDQFLDRLLEKNKAMGSLIIAKNGEIQYNRSIGFSQIDGVRKTPLTETSRYRIGSVTKMFTATMIFQLVEQGKLQLNDPLAKYYPAIPNADKITIRQILGHRSGIHDISTDRSLEKWRVTGKQKDEIMELIAKSTPDFAPDTKYAYSNSGYFILGSLIEKLSGKTYEEVLNERILASIDLKDTYAASGNADLSKNESISYRYLADWKAVQETHPSVLFGAGSLISTPSDMMKFIQALFDLKLISKESLAQMTENSLGIEAFNFADKTFYGHTGGVDGFGAWLAYQPEDKLTLSYATNGKVYPVKDIMAGIAAMYYNKPFEIPTFESMAISEEILNKYVGTYAMAGSPAKFTITRQGTTLYATPPNQSSAALEPIAENKFKIESMGISFEFDVAKNQMIIRRNGNERVLNKEN